MLPDRNRLYPPAADVFPCGAGAAPRLAGARRRDGRRGGRGARGTGRGPRFRRRRSGHHRRDDRSGRTAASGPPRRERDPRCARNHQALRVAGGLGHLRHRHESRPDPHLRLSREARGLLCAPDRAGAGGIGPAPRSGRPLGARRVARTCRRGGRGMGDRPVHPAPGGSPAGWTGRCRSRRPRRRSGRGLGAAGGAAGDPGARGGVVLEDRRRGGRSRGRALGTDGVSGRGVAGSAHLGRIRGAGRARVVRPSGRFTPPTSSRRSPPRPAEPATRSVSRPTPTASKRPGA